MRTLSCCSKSVQLRHDPEHRLGLGALHLRYRQHRQFAELLAWPRSAIEQPAKNPRRLSTALRHVNVWQGVIADQNISHLDQRLADVAVQVEGDHQRGVDTDRIADPLQHIRVGFIDAVRNHRAVDGEQHAVEVALPGARDNSLGQIVERRAIDQTGGNRTGEQRGNQLKVLMTALGDEAANLGVGTLVYREQRIAFDQCEAAEGVEIRAERTEAVGLVPDAAEQDPPAHPFTAGPRCRHGTPK